jgi:glycosyltransferase involved in cell wall biosynthesis
MPALNWVWLGATSIGALMASEIVVNGRFEGRRLTGVERYASEVLRCLGPGVKVIKPQQTLTGLRGHFWEQLLLPRALAAGEFLWSPANTGPLAVMRQAVTIHDLSVLEHPEWFNVNFRLWYRLLLPRLAQRVTTILTVSEHSRRSIVRMFRLPAEKVMVVPDGVNLRQFHPCDAGAVRAKYELGNRYVLFVGSLDPRKNIERLLQAWVRLIEFKDLELVIAGSRTNIFRPVDIASSKRRTRFLGYVPDEDLPALYAGATFFIMPSLFEGFGLSMLEAMACGTPVITSYAGALAEVAGEAAVQIDPTSVEGMTEAMRTLLLDEGLRSDLRQKGLERACQFPWERSAQRIWEVMSANA